jgi:hypothetical protein
MKPVAAHSISERLNNAGVFTEVAEAKLAECVRIHADAVAALHASEAAVTDPAIGPCCHDLGIC